MTVDGRIASKTGYSRLSCDEDFDLQHELRSKSDIVIVGSETAIIDNPRLSVRRIPGRTPKRGVVDSKLRVSPSSLLFRRPGGVLITTEDHGYAELEPYLRAGVEVIQAGIGRVDLPKAWRELYRVLGIKKVMVEGGGHLNFALLNNGLVDEIWVTIAPFVFGAGISLFEGSGFDGFREIGKLRLKKVVSLCGGGWINLRYEVLTPRSALV